MAENHKAGKSINALIDFSDIYPTLLDIAYENIAIPTKDDLDGMSILPLLMGQKEEIRDSSFCWYMERTDSTDIKSFVQNTEYKLHHDGRFIDKLNDKFEQNPIPNSKLTKEMLIIKSDFEDQMRYYMNLRPDRIAYNDSQPTELPGLLELEKYDIGLPNVTYNDNTKGNITGGFWRRDDVDILSTRGRHVITETEKGEWLEYSVNVKSAQEFSVHINYSAKTDGEIHFELNGKKITQEIPLPRTEDGNLNSLKLPELIPFFEGTSVLRIYINKGGAELDSLIFH